MAISINKHARREKFYCDAQLKVNRAKVAEGAADPGSLTGYLAIYGTLDVEGEVFRPGCFTKSIKQKVAAGKVPLMCKHFRDGGDSLECIGSIRNATEDETGVLIEDAPFSSDSDSQKMRTKVAEGHVRGLSIGFRPLRWESRLPTTDDEKAICARAMRTEIIEWVECEISEGTVTCRGAHEDAVILDAKNSAVKPGSEKPAPADPSTRSGSPALTAATRKKQRDRELEILGVR